MADETSMQKLFRALLDDPSSYHWALDLSKVTGLGPNVLYPLLARLEQEGRVQSGWADPDSPYPRRRGYMLTEAGVEYYREVLPS